MYDGESMNDHAIDHFIPVQVDKSHIITIGERLYTESIEFIREIVNNAYDADATLVEVVLGTDTVEVRDNGTGMDRDGLIQFFNIGSQEKIERTKSSRLGREMIGQFGIGKFASLAACGRFEVINRKKDFAARVIFDKKEVLAERKTAWLFILPKGKIRPCKKCYAIT